MMKGTDKGKFSPMTLFAWLAIGVGVGAMSSLLSVMYGFEGSLQERVLKAYPHVMVKHRDAKPIGGFESWTERIKAIPGAVKVQPYAESEMVVQSDHRTLGAVIWGTPQADMERLKKDISSGGLPKMDSPLPQVIVGSELAGRLGLSLESRLKLISPLERSGAFGLVPQSQLFEVSGLYSSGHYEFDEQYLFLVLEDFQDLLGWKNEISGWQVWTDDFKKADELTAAIAAILPSEWEAVSWTTFNSALFQSLKLEQYAMFFILTFAILIAVLNVVITLTMHVAHKRKNIGVLRALGSTKSQVRQVFLWQGLFMGGVGLTLGALLTTLFVFYLRNFSTFQLPDIYYDRSIPIELRPVSLALIYGVASVLIFLATLYPSAKAAALDPIEAIRE